MEQLLINEIHFKNVGHIAPHCDKDLISTYIWESQNIILKSWLCDAFLIEIIENADKFDYQCLLNGSVYNRCNGQKASHYGIKKILAHLSYGTYIYRSSITNTQTGTVLKYNADDSVPIEVSELEKIRNEHHRIAKDLFRMTRDYLCHNLEAFKNVSRCHFDCKCDCNCDDTTCETYGSNRTYQVKVIDVKNRQRKKDLEQEKLINRYKVRT